MPTQSISPDVALSPPNYPISVLTLNNPGYAKLPWKLGQPSVRIIWIFSLVSGEQRTEPLRGVAELWAGSFVKEMFLLLELAVWISSSWWAELVVCHNSIWDEQWMAPYISSTHSQDGTIMTITCFITYNTNLRQTFINHINSIYRAEIYFQVNTYLLMEHILCKDHRYLGDIKQSASPWTEKVQVNHWERGWRWSEEFNAE